MAEARQRLTEILSNLDVANPRHAEALTALVHDELHALASRQLSRERAGHTLQPTALVHEAYLRLFDPAVHGWENRAHFFGAAATAMRRVLVDHARRRNAQKRGGGFERVTLRTDLVSDDAVETDFLDLHTALERLAALEPQLARLVELRFFTGLTLDETADALGVSRRKAANDWAAARLWLRNALGAN